jgi:hypothetical protein
VSGRTTTVTVSTVSLWDDGKRLKPLPDSNPLGSTAMNRGVNESVSRQAGIITRESGYKTIS